MKFQAARIHFLGDVLAAVAGVVAWWLSDRVTNRYYMISDFSQVEVFKILFQNNIGTLSLFSLLGISFTDIILETLYGL